MPDALRDPVWQFVGAAVAVIGIFLAVVLHRLQRNKKSLAYEVLTFAPVLTVREISEEKIVVLYGGVPVKRLILCVIRVANTGNTPITAGDFETPLSFTAGAEAEIVSAVVMRTDPLALSPSIAIRPKAPRNSVELSPLLLNSGDCITFKPLISTETAQGIHAKGRIVGVKDIVCVPASEREPLRAVIVLSALGSVIKLVLAVTAFSLMYGLFGAIITPNLANSLGISQSETSNFLWVGALVVILIMIFILEINKRRRRQSR